LLPKEVKATVGVHIGLRAVNITLLGKCVQTTQTCKIVLLSKAVSHVAENVSGVQNVGVVSEDVMNDSHDLMMLLGAGK